MLGPPPGNMRGFPPISGGYSAPQPVGGYDGMSTRAQEDLQTVANALGSANDGAATFLDRYRAGAGAGAGRAGGVGNVGANARQITGGRGAPLTDKYGNLI